jgi:hypothetical protein
VPYHSRRRSGPCSGSATLPTVPMILAASMGPGPKISVRVVPEASTSASMHLFRSAIFRSSVPDVAQDLRSQPPTEAGRGALGPYAAQDACG